MSKTDITTLSDFDGANATFKGFYLGMSKKDAIAQLDRLENLTWRFDDWNTKSKDPLSNAQMRIYVRLKDPIGNDDPEVLYLLWEKGSTAMSSLVFYKAASPMLAGNTSRLFSVDALDPACTCRQFLKGNPKESVDDIGIRTYSFKLQHFELISMGSDEKTVWFKLQ
jgi:hypothetical protein